MEEKDPNAINDWYDRGAKGATAKKYRKGACENCGALTHKRKDCLERPRKKGAKFTNKDIAADEIVRDIELGYDAKRDRWNGYDPSEHKKVYEDDSSDIDPKSLGSAAALQVSRLYSYYS